ncbi:hypothetical protein VAE122_40008 [Vibrio aestuarianus]|nr:hypothetical protein VAE122_40008 [Vibrio aestuarianus]
MLIDVHCRTGSLEIEIKRHSITVVVHCRTGSLEKKILNEGLDGIVHCRTGSLETTKAELLDIMAKFTAAQAA